MDNFFNNQNNNSNKNEQLLDEIMEQQKKRDDKIAPKGYLLKNDKKEVSVFKQADVQNDDDNVTNIFVAENYQVQDRGEPMFVIDDNKKSSKFKGKGKQTNQSTSYYNTAKNGKKPSNHKKLGIFILCCFLFVVAFVAIAAAIIFTENHYVNITCGYLDGITLKNQNDETIERINLKFNQSFRFKVLVNDGYKNDSAVTVTFNDVEVKPDVFGLYTIRNTNNVLNLHIGGIRPDQFTMNLEDNGYYLLDRNSDAVSFENKNFKTNDILTFRVMGDNIESNTFSVYYNNTLQTAGSDGFYNVRLNKTGTISILPHSAYEFFNFESSTVSGKTVYNIIGLTSLGASKEKIYFPDKYNNASVYIKVDEKLSYPAVKYIGIPKSADYVEPQNFNAFISLERFEVFDCYEPGVLSVENGMLTSTVLESSPGNKREIKKIYVIPQSLPQNAQKKLEFLKSEQNDGYKKVYSFSKNCFYNLNTVKEVTINADDVIFADAGFNSLSNKNAIKFNITSKSYKSVDDGKVILKAASDNNYSILFSVPYCSGKFVIPQGVTQIDSNAFAFTKITEFDFSKVTSLSLNKSAFANLLEVETIKLPSFVTSISDTCFGECVKLKTVDLTELSSAILVSTSAVEGCYNTDIKILVKSDLLDAFKTVNPNIESLFTTLEQNNDNGENSDNGENNNNE